MNRKVQWEQQPANLDDYAPECLDPKLPVQFQMAPPKPLPEENLSQANMKTAKGDSRKAPTPVATPQQRASVSPLSYQRGPYMVSKINKKGLDILNDHQILQMVFFGDHGLPSSMKVCRW